MKRIIAAIALAAVALCAMPSQANDKKVKVTAAGTGLTTMEIKVTTVDKKTVTDPQTETITVTIPAAPTTATKAAAIVAAFAGATNVTAKLDPADNTQVIITSNADRSISRVDARPLKSGERDKLAALGPVDGESATATALLGFQLEGTGSKDGTATLTINGVPFTVSTSSGELFGDVLLALKAAIDPDAIYDASIVGNELQITGSVLGYDYAAFVTDAEGTPGYSYGFSSTSFPEAAPEPATLALLGLGLAGLGLGRRKQA